MDVIENFAGPSPKKACNLVTTILILFLHKVFIGYKTPKILVTILVTCNRSLTWLQKPSGLLVTARLLP
jgi:hypothetical protein